MAGILYHNVCSPPSRMALLAIRNLGLNIQVKNVDIYSGEQHSAEYLKVNPLNQVPAYVEGNFKLNESKAIATYLASVAKSSLYPTDFQKRAVIDAKLYYDSNNVFPAVRDFVRPVIRAGVKKIDKQRRDDLKAMMGKLDAFLEKSEWFGGEELSLADIAFLANVGTAKCLGENFKDFPRLKLWYARCSSLPGFAENEEGATALAKKVEVLLEEPLWPSN